MGHPVDLVDDAEAIIFGDFTRYYLNLGDSITIKADGSVAFRTGGIVYRAMALADGGCADEEAFAIATTA
jgi:HK97 family phage major capsid protein